jgi:hypothetical protein
MSAPISLHYLARRSQGSSQVSTQKLAEASPPHCFSLNSGLPFYWKV